MIKGIGIDIVEVERIRQSIEKYKERFRDKIFTEEEINYSMQFKDKEYIHLAARFAVKEAFSKAIGTGLTQGFKFREISVRNLPSGEPILILSGKTQEKYGKYNFHISISHSETNAVAVVIMEE